MAFKLKKNVNNKNNICNFFYSKYFECTAKKRNYIHTRLLFSECSGIKYLTSVANIFLRTPSRRESAEDIK